MSSRSWMLLGDSSRPVNSGVRFFLVYGTLLNKMRFKLKIKNRILKRTQRGFRGYPVGTVAYYGPDNRKATKVAVGIIASEGADVGEMKQWFTEAKDARLDEHITTEILQYLDQQGVMSVAGSSKLLGCPHEEGIDYPEGESCPECPYWKGRDRWDEVVKEYEEE